MSKLFSKSNQLLYILCLLFITLIGSSILFLPHGQSGLTLFVLLSLVAIVAFLAGRIIALEFSLILFFILGSTFFWFSLSGSFLFVRSIPIELFLIWMGIVVVVALLAGSVSVGIRNMHEKVITQREQIFTLVAIDPVTMFDNKERFEAELGLEFSRSKCYEHMFSLLFIRLVHIDSFIKLYGQKEFEHVLKHIASVIFESTRLSDHKFRAKKDMFALLLPDTPIEDMEIVITKLTDALETIPLSNNKTVEIPIAFGYSSYHKQAETYTDMYEEAQSQVQTNVS